jgi:hypothetical protein
MKKLFMMLCFAGTVAAATAQTTAAPAQNTTAAPDPNAPEFKWDQTTIDYGTVTKNDESNAKREFKFTNTGKSPLIISECHGSCGCTVPTCPKDPILPGAKGSIQVHYAVDRVGPFTKTVTVSSNAKNSNETLKIQGTVIDPDAGKTPTPPTTPTPAPTTPK